MKAKKRNFFAQACGESVIHAATGPHGQPTLCGLPTTEGGWGIYESGRGIKLSCFDCVRKQGKE